MENDKIVRSPSTVMDTSVRTNLSPVPVEKKIFFQALPPESNEEEPSEEPTEEPSEEPTDEPTELPTGSSTSMPSVATNNPTLSPTDSPTYSPSFSPSAAPTASPTFEPTVAPTHLPTYSPTVSPSAIPSAEPTLSPSHQPSFPPTVAPSLPPSTAPTPSPSSAATTFSSRSPTLAPTVLVTVTFKVGTTYTFGLVNGSSLVSLSTDTINQAISRLAPPFSTFEIERIYVKGGGGSGGGGSRRLSAFRPSIHLHNIIPPTTYYTYGADVNYFFNMINFPNASSVEEVMTEKAQLILTIGKNGTFQQTLRNLAIQNNAFQLLNTTVENVNTSAVITNSPTTNKNDRYRLTDAQIAGIVIGVVVGCLVCCLSFFFCVNNRRRSKHVTPVIGFNQDHPPRGGASGRGGDLVKQSDGELAI